MNNNKTLTIVSIAAVAASFIATTPITTKADSAFAKYRKKQAQSTAQANAGGNGSLSLISM